MRVLNVRNAHEALPKGLILLDQHGVDRDSRGGLVRQCTSPVTTVYVEPCERVIFWPERDANPFFHLYESLWMLAGRNDVEPLVRYAKQMGEYADNGLIHGAYGFRWRRHFDIDQLLIITERLRKNPTDRQCVLQMWDVEADLGQSYKDLPCNTIATFQRDWRGDLDLTVFCRSNDIVWGAYGANAVHFSFLLEYMARWIGCPIGKYYQVSVNYHGYHKTLKPLESLQSYSSWDDVFQPYSIEAQEPIYYLPMLPQIGSESVDEWVKRADRLIAGLLYCADNEFPGDNEGRDTEIANYPWSFMIWSVLYAHHLHKLGKTQEAIEFINQKNFRRIDWVVAARQWLQRRLDRENNK